MTIAESLYKIQQQIAETARLQGRNPEEIRLMGVTKGQSPEIILQAFKAGLTDFGENYWQEAKDKLAALQNYPMIWHFIGHIQSNKTADIARHFDWVHCVTSEKIAKRLHQQRPETALPLNVCIQVDLDDEPGKSGIQPDEILSLAKAISLYPNLKLRGLMAIPKPRFNELEQYKSLLRLRHLLEKSNQEGSFHMDTLSMGMSDDLAAAIKAGSTMLRIGRAIFGERS